MTKLILGDCQEALKELKENSIDSIVTLYSYIEGVIIGL